LYSSNESCNTTQEEVSNSEGEVEAERSCKSATTEEQMMIKKIEALLQKEKEVLTQEHKEAQNITYPKKSGRVIRNRRLLLICGSCLVVGGGLYIWNSRVFKLFRVTSSWAWWFYTKIPKIPFF